MLKFLLSPGLGRRKLPTPTRLVERPTGKKHTTVGWDDGGKIGKIIN